MSYDTTTNYNIWRNICPSCHTSKHFRKINGKEYLIIQSGTTNAAKHVLGLIPLTPKFLNGVFQLAIGQVKQAHMAHCKGCDVNYYRCSQCKNIHPVGIGVFNPFLTCKSCGTKLHD